MADLRIGKKRSGFAFNDEGLLETLCLADDADYLF